MSHKTAALKHAVKNTQVNALQMQAQPLNDNVVWRQEVLSTIGQLAKKFGKRTSIRGLDRLFCAEYFYGYYRKLIRLMIFMVFLLGAGYICILLSGQLNQVKFQTLVHDSRVPIYTIEFPSVTICNLNRLNWERIDEAKERFLPNETSSEILILFEKIVGVYDDLVFAHFNDFDILENATLHLLNHVNFSSVFDFMTWRCEEFLTQCIWNHETMDCCQIFVQRRTKNGICWSFNTMESLGGRLMAQLDPMYPWRTSRAGRGSGFRVRTLIHPEKHYPNRTNLKGINVMITELNVWHKDPFIIPEYTETTIEIEPVLYFYDNDTRYVPSALRECVFDDESESPNYKSLQGMVYMIENCEAQCHQEYLVKYCNCTIDLMFPTGPYRSCKVQDLLCLAQNNEFFMYSHQPGEEKFVRNPYTDMVCPCFRNCHSMNAYADAQPTFLPPERRGNVSFIDLDVYFRSPTMMVYRTRLIFNWLDFIAAFGGIVGLFLGVSVVSMLELAQFGLVELPCCLLKILWQITERRRENRRMALISTLKFRGELLHESHPESLGK